MKKIKKYLKKFSKIMNENSRKLKKNDLIIIGILVIIYSLIAIPNLGSVKAPQTFYNFDFAGSEAGIEIKGSETEISKIRHYSGDEVGSYQLFASVDGSTYEEIGKFSDEVVFSWQDDVINEKFKYLKIVAVDGGSYIGEVSLYDKYGNKVELMSNNENSKVLVDESNTVPGLISYKNSMYFDEIYFARSAYEYIHGINTIEWVHPPLGKLIQAIPILIFGMTPFTWRIMGTIAGILMIPVMYIFGKDVFRKRKYALLAALLMLFDCFHFAHTRIGTVDSYLVLFGMLSSLFMYKYLLLNKYDSVKPKLKYLGLSGLFFGLATCVKWTGLYLGLGLAVVFFGKFILDYIKDKKISNQYVKIILFCLLFFIFIPSVIYVLSYLLFPNVNPNGVHGIRDLLTQIKDMYSYHANLKDTHDFSSKWYTWLIMYKPVWYAVTTYGSDLKSTIVAIGNPAIWWVGIPAIIYLIVATIREKCKYTAFILSFIICTWLPYIFIGRCMFMYHFFPTLPFIILGITALIKWLCEKFKNNYVYLIYLLIVIFFFIYFFPVISGKVVSVNYVEVLRWFSSWVF